MKFVDPTKLHRKSGRMFHVEQSESTCTSTLYRSAWFFLGKSRAGSGHSVYTRSEKALGASSDRQNRLRGVWQTDRLKPLKFGRQLPVNRSKLLGREQDQVSFDATKRYR